MQKTEKILEIGQYRVSCEPERTREAYRALPEGEGEAAAFFRHLLSRAEEKSLGFLEEMGVDPTRLSLCRPLTEPDERGEILYLSSAPFCGRVLAGGETEPRQSEEVAGMGVIFVGEGFSPNLPRFPEPMAEMRFVIPLPFDGSYFE